MSSEQEQFAQAMAKAMEQPQHLYGKDGFALPIKEVKKLPDAADDGDTGGDAPE